MKRWWIALGALVGLLVIGFLVLTLFIDAESFRGPIEQALTDNTGWDATIGELDFSIFRGMVVAVRNAELAAPGDTSYARVGTLEVEARFWPLLKGELHIEGITLDSPEVRLVRPDLESGWVLPTIPGSASGAAPGSSPAAQGSPSTPTTATPSPAAGQAPAETGGSGPAVILDSIRLTDGRVSIEDHSVSPPLVIGLGDVGLELKPTTSELEGSATLEPGGGRLGFRGTPTGGFGLTLEGVPTEFLHAWASPELIHPGGKLTGDIELEVPFRLTGVLEGEGIVLLAGEKPFDVLKMEFEAGAEGETVVLRSLELAAGPLIVNGGGTLAPAIALDFALVEAPLEAALVASESAMPIPLDVDPPGAVQANVRIRQSGTAPLTYEADGEVSAAVLRLGAPLPPADGVRAGFVLSPAGELTIELLDGNVGGGPLRGTARLDSIEPLGTLKIDGELADASLGALLGGFAQAASGLKGPTRIESDLALDLSQPAGSFRALSGQVRLGSSEVSMPGWDLDRSLGQALTGSSGGSEGAAGDNTAVEAVERLLESIDASINFDTWPWSLEGFKMAVGDFSSTGAGTYDPEAGAVELQLQALLTPERSAELVAKNGELRYLMDDAGRLTLPLKLSGELTSPRVEVELDDLLAQALDRERDKLEDDLEEKAKEKLGGLLDSLLGKKKDDD